jgi:hypothetical protein
MWELYAAVWEELLVGFTTRWEEEGVINHAGGSSHCCGVGGGSCVAHAECTAEWSVGIHPVYVLEIS